MTTIQDKYNDLLLKKFQQAPFTDINQPASLEAPGSSALKIPAANIMNQAIPTTAPSDMTLDTS